MILYFRLTVLNHALLNALPTTTVVKMKLIAAMDNVVTDLVHVTQLMLILVAQYIREQLKTQAIMFLLSELL